MVAAAARLVGATDDGSSGVITPSSCDSIAAKKVVWNRRVRKVYESSENHITDNYADQLQPIHPGRNQLFQDLLSHLLILNILVFLAP
jgi:hypothetical protein